jgi:exosortase/archaeosortase family protein
MQTRLKLRFAGILLGYGGAVFLIYRNEVLGTALAPLAVETARLVLAMLHFLGLEALRDGAVILHPGGFAYEIAYTCTGFLPVVTFLVCGLAYPVAWRARWIGVMIGIPVLWIINLLRLVGLFYIGVYFPSTFAWAHEVAGEIFLGAAFIGLWLGWVGWSSSRLQSTNPASKSS